METQIKINDEQRVFILKAIWNISSIYDFDNTTDEEFKNTYDISKKELIKITNELSEILRS